MRKRASIKFIPASDKPGAHLKFGGLPFGMPALLWPKSKQTGEPMQFICQIPFGPDLFPGTLPSVAYLFMTQSSDQAEETWLPEGGENRLVILPVSELTSSFLDQDVPRLHQMEKRWWSKRLLPKTCVFTATLGAAEDPDFVPDVTQATWTEEQRKAYGDAVEGNKIGGSPWFLQSDELPFADSWHLLLQLDSTRTPFWINFGDAGVGYAFINAQGNQGRFLWQCC